MTQQQLQLQMEMRRIKPKYKGDLSKARIGDLVLISGGPRDLQPTFALFKGQDKTGIDTYHAQGEKICFGDPRIIEVYFDYRENMNFSALGGAILRERCGYVTIGIEDAVNYNNTVQELKQAGIWER